jgi:hypothetical protein
MRLVTAGANAGDLEQWPGSSTRPEPSLSKTGFDPLLPVTTVRFGGIQYVQLICATRPSWDGSRALAPEYRVPQRVSW